MREVGFGKTLSEAGQGLMRANNPFEKDIDAVERGVRSINLIATLGGVYRGAQKGALQAGLIKKYKLTPGQASLVMQAADTAKRLQNEAKGKLAGGVASARDRLSPRQQMRAAGDVTAAAKERGLFDKPAHPTGAEKHAEFLKRTEEIKRQFRELKKQGAVRANRRTAGAVYVPFPDIGLVAYTAAEWADQAKSTVTAALDKLEIPSHIRSEVGDLAQSILDKGVRDGIPARFASGHDLRPILDYDDLHVTFADTSKRGLYYNKETGAVAIMEGGFAGAEQLNQWMLGKSPGQRIWNSVDARPRAVLVAANSPENILASHGPTILIAELKSAIERFGVEKLTKQIEQGLPSNNPIRTLLLTNLDSPRPDLRNVMKVVQGLPPGERKKTVVAVLKAGEGMLPDVRKVLSLATDPLSMQARTGDLVGAFQVDPERPLTGQRMSSYYDFNLPVQVVRRLPDRISVYDLFPQLTNDPRFIGLPSRLRFAIERKMRLPYSKKVMEDIIGILNRNE